MQKLWQIAERWVSGAVHFELYISLLKRQADEKRKYRRPEVEKHPDERKKFLLLMRGFVTEPRTSENNDDWS